MIKFESKLGVDEAEVERYCDAKEVINKGIIFIIQEKINTDKTYFGVEWLKLNFRWMR